MRFRLVSLLCTLAVVLAVTAAPAAAAGTSIVATPTQSVLSDHEELGIWGGRAGLGAWGGWGYPWPGGAPSWAAPAAWGTNWLTNTDCVCAWGGSWGAPWSYPGWGWGMPIINAPVAGQIGLPVVR